MKSYSKELILNEIISLLKYHKEEKNSLLFANLLLNKVTTKKEITLNETNKTHYEV